jgi:hypothetical protein
MKEVIDIRSNLIFGIEDKTGALLPRMEIVIIHTDGKIYTKDDDNEQKLVVNQKYEESRLIVNAETLSSFITELQFHKKKLDSLRANADQLNSLIKFASENKDLIKEK